MHKVQPHNIQISDNAYNQLHTARLALIGVRQLLTQARNNRDRDPQLEYINAEPMAAMLELIAEKMEIAQQ